MGEFLNTLRAGLTEICPAYTHVPSGVPYPYITLEAEHTLQGLPWGPLMAVVMVKIWSRYEGMKEILKLADDVEGYLYKQSFTTSLKILESSLVLLNDGQTRVHTLRLKARLTV